MSLFQKKSSFDEEADARKAWAARLPTRFEQEQERLFASPPFPTPGVKNVALSRTAVKQDGPSHAELEDWYQTLNDLVHHRGGFIDEDAIVDLRDSIYKYLR